MSEGSQGLTLTNFGS